MVKLKISVLHKLFSFFVAIGVAIGVAAPFAITVKAEDETSTYTYVEGDCINGNLNSFANTWSTSTNVRVTFCYKTSGSNSNSFIAFVSDEPFTYINVGGITPGCAISGSSRNADAVVINGVTYYCLLYTQYSYFSNIVVNGENAMNMRINPYINLGYSQMAIYYTYGDGAVGPTPPEPEVELLGLKNLRYNTRLVGHGTQGYQNIDEITWDPGRDLGENFLVGGKVQIRAVSGKYAALTYDGLKALSIGDFSFVGNPVVLASDIVATVGSFSVTWQTVYNSLSLTALNIKAYQDAAGYWNREGWVYQYRYKLDNSTTTTDYSDWFTVYSFTSASGDSTVGLDNNLVAQPGSDGLYNNVVDSFNDINTINADITNNYNTNNYYYIDNNQYLINPDTTQQNTDQQSTWDQFTYKFHEYHDSEDLLINDMNNAIEDLTPSADLNRNNNFLNAANWVRVQFDQMTLNTPMELIIIFSLTLGFGLLLIGRFK